MDDMLDALLDGPAASMGPARGSGSGTSSHAAGGPAAAAVPAPAHGPTGAAAALRPKQEQSLEDRLDAL
jgi:hypothetical protein